MATSSKELSDLIPAADAPIAVRRRRWRALKDLIAKYGIAVGGIGVIIAVVLIFFYLLYVVFPLFMPASMNRLHAYAVPGGNASQTLLLAMEEQAEVGVRFTGDGQVIFFDVADGALRDSMGLSLPEGTRITASASGTVGTGVVALGLSDGTVLIAQHTYEVTYPEDKRLITPRVEYPLGREPVVIDEAGQALERLAILNAEDGSTALAAVTVDGRMVATRLTVEESFLGDTEISQETAELPEMPGRVTHIAVSSDHRWVFAVSETARLGLIDVADMDDPELVDLKEITRDPDEEVSVARMLMGGVSLLIGTSQGRVEQWFPVRDDRNVYSVERIREFEAGCCRIVHLEPEMQRKGFAAVDEEANRALIHTTAERTALELNTGEHGVTRIAMAPRSDKFIALDATGQMQVWDVHNEHPDVSFSALWSRVWYEGYQEPEYIWQSSAANQDFEPKFSLTPLAFGTLKAAFYAMMVAVPLAIMGAIYTAYFMNSGMRQLVKPTIEIMEALPTVILGFLAGLWLAPFMEAHLPGVFALLIFMPIGVLLFGYVWHKLPKAIRTRVPDGWQAALLIPAVALIGWFRFAASAPLEFWLFDGDFRSWLTNDLGIDYDQRNSVVIGFAMGFAVIPTIFSITEDAIFGVPKHLSFGSLALGATPWQTLVRVVMPSASPGIFSAVMIGMGRAVGETMIVLMATGNTPIMDMNIFEGMRTLAANIAVEMPESEVASTHYRVLFLAGLVLFLFTFIVNTVAEVVRQRLRRKYATL